MTHECRNAARFVPLPPPHNAVLPRIARGKLVAETPFREHE